jgi:putative tryptophan/tyrosine transport system substrate-binding protein
MIGMRRREFILLLGNAGLLCAAKARGARAQQPAMPAVGFLRGGSLTDVPVDRVTAFHQGLKEAGFVEGQNVAIEYRSDEYRTDRLRLLVADLLHGQVAVIVGDTPAALAAKAVTTTVPIVFVTGGDPVRVGLVASLNRPVGNVTGVSFTSVELAAKQLGLLRELRPGAASIACSSIPNSPLPSGLSQRSELRLRSLDSNSSSSKSAATAKSRPPSQRSSNVGLARCSGVPAGSCCHNGNELSR